MLHSWPTTAGTIFGSTSRTGPGIDSSLSSAKSPVPPQSASQTRKRVSRNRYFISVLQNNHTALWPGEQIRGWFKNRLTQCEENTLTRRRARPNGSCAPALPERTSAGTTLASGVAGTFFPLDCPTSRAAPSSALARPTVGRRFAAAQLLVAARRSGRRRKFRRVGGWSRRCRISGNE